MHQERAHPQDATPPDVALNVVLRGGQGKHFRIGQ
jgi:hypothetical protein